jgi:uncharacterized protein
MANRIRRLVLDILKPYDPEINIVCTELLDRYPDAVSDGSSISGINITVMTMDRLTQGVKIVIEGTNLDYDEINDILISLNCIIHSLDQCVAGDVIIEDVDTPQDAG